MELSKVLIFYSQYIYETKISINMFMEHIVRPLTIKDLPDLKLKIEGCTTFNFANTKASMTKEDFLKYSLGLFSLDRHLIHGYFLNGELTSMITSHELRIIPSYIVKNYKVFNPSVYFSPKKNGWNMLLTDVIKYFESKKFYSFYAMQGADEKRNYNMRKSVEILQNYDYSIEEYVLANTKSKYGLHDQTMYYGKTISVDTIVNRYACRQQNRDSLINE